MAIVKSKKAAKKNSPAAIGLSKTQVLGLIEISSKKADKRIAALEKSVQALKAQISKKGSTQPKAKTVKAKAPKKRAAKKRIVMDE